MFGCLATYNHPSAVSHTITFAAAVFKLIIKKLNVALNIGPHNTILPKSRAFITFNELLNTNFINKIFKKLIRP